MAKYAVKYRKQMTRLSTTAINMLMAYHWPGNVRELENCIERAVLTSTDGAIHGYNLPASLQTGERAGATPASLSSMPSSVATVTSPPPAGHSASRRA